MGYLLFILIMLLMIVSLIVLFKLIYYLRSTNIMYNSITSNLTLTRDDYYDAHHAKIILDIINESIESDEYPEKREDRIKFIKTRVASIDPDVKIYSSKEYIVVSIKSRYCINIPMDKDI